MGLFDKIKNYVNIYKLVKTIVELIRNWKMNSKTETIKGIVRAMILIAGVLGYNVAPEFAELITTILVSIWALFEFIMGVKKPVVKKDE